MGLKPIELNTISVYNKRNMLAFSVLSINKKSGEAVVSARSSPMLGENQGARARCSPDYTTYSVYLFC